MVVKWRVFVSISRRAYGQVQVGVCCCTCERSRACVRIYRVRAGACAYGRVCGGRKRLGGKRTGGKAGAAACVGTVNEGLATNFAHTCVKGHFCPNVGCSCSLCVVLHKETSAVFLPRPSSNQTPTMHKQAIERTIIYFSIGIQATLTFTVVGFCAYQLNRCPVDSPTKENADSGLADLGSCPRALYTNMITAAVAYWFPSPWYAFISNNSDVQPLPARKRTTKVNAGNSQGSATVVEEDD